jgi:purine nucleoside permease
MRDLQSCLCVAVFLALLPALKAQSSATPVNSAEPKPWPVRAAIVTTFEAGEDTGDKPGEFQFWVEREHLDQKLDFPGGVHPIRTNAAHTVLGIVSGTTLVNATASLMALGLDPRFDLTHAYWLINGIAGVDPNDASIGSAAWANYVVSDVAREIDSREIPADWPYGIFPVGAKRPNPNAHTANDWSRSNLYSLNGKLTNWAYSLTKNLSLPDTPEIAAFRSHWTGYPNARRPPFVLKGDVLASDYYWHGRIMTRYANDWVKLYTEGRGNFVMTAMEDSGFTEALERLDKMHRVDFRRVMVLRTASNYCMQQPGHSAVESVSAPYIGELPALESAWLVGSTVLHQILTDWPVYAGHVPGD